MLYLTQASTDGLAGQARGPGYGADAAAPYRVLVKLYWYEQDGTTVLGQANGRLEWYVAYVGLDSIFHKGYCSDYED